MKIILLKIKGLWVFLIILILFSILFLKCTKDPYGYDDGWYDEQVTAEKEKINNYINNLKSQGYTVEEINGIYFILHETDSSGKYPASDSLIILDFIEKDLDGNIKETNIQEYKSQWAGADIYTNYVFNSTKIKFGYSLPGVNIGLSIMQEGDSASMIIPSSLAYNDFNPIDLTIKLHKVISNYEEYDSLQINRRLAVNNMDPDSTYISDWGIYFKEIISPPLDSTTQINASDTIIVSFEAYYLLNDTTVEFESSIELEIPFSSLNLPTGMVPFDNGIKTVFDSVRIGSEAIVIVPYNKAFGESGYLDPVYRYIIIPTYTSLMYDLNIVGRKE